MAAVAVDGAGCYTPAAEADTIAGPVFIDRIKWHGGAIALGDTLLIEGALEDGDTAGVIFEHIAGAADQPWCEEIKRTFFDVVVTTWTSDNGTVRIYSRSTQPGERHTTY